MLYTLSEVVTLCKQNMGIRDLPKPVTDKDLRDRVINSSLKEFSVRKPYITTHLINENERICPDCMDGRSSTLGQNNMSQRYRIPKHYYQDRTILSIPRLDVWRPSGFNDYYVPQGMVGDPVSIMTALADLKVSAEMARSMSRAPTFKFQAPDILYVYNGWAAATYEIEIATTHDESLSTIPPTAMTQFIQLAQLDLEEYMYTRLKRVQNLDLGIGSIELKIDEWQDSGNRKRDLLKEWSDNGANLDIDNIYFF